MSNTKMVEEYVYNGLGYPITLKNIRFYLYEGEWAPIIDVNMIALAEYHRLSLINPQYILEAENALINRIKGVL